MEELTPLRITMFQKDDIIVNKIVDDSIVYNIHEYTYCIKSINYTNGTYNIEQIDNGLTEDVTWDWIHRHCRLWNITYAYTGDILYNKNDNIYVIYNSTCNNYNTIWVAGSYIVNTRELVLSKYEEGHDIQGYKIASFGERCEFIKYINSLGYTLDNDKNVFVKIENEDQETEQVKEPMYTQGDKLININNNNIKIAIENIIRIPEHNKCNYCVYLYENNELKGYYQLDSDFIENEYKPIYDKFTLKLQKILEEYPKNKSNKTWDEFCYEYGKTLKELINEDK